MVAVNAKVGRKLSANDNTELVMVAEASLMKSIVRIWLLVVATLSPAALASPVSAQISPEFRNSKIVLYEGQKGDGGYWKTNTRQTKEVTEGHKVLRERLMKRHALEEYAEFLSPLRLPLTLGLFASDCEGNDGDSPYYSSRTRSINMCYGFIAEAEDNLSKLVQLQKALKFWQPVSTAQYLAGLYTAVLFHETAHALVDILDVPVFGREEDAADQLAAYLALQVGEKNARTIILGFAYYWQAARDPNLFDQYIDVHGTASQRLYNTLCIVYGGDPDSFQDFVDSGWLPPERAKHCAREYQQVEAAFAKTVLPFIDQEQMKKVQARRWFLPTETMEQPLEPSQQ